jgi:hypothetical protein
VPFGWVNRSRACSSSIRDLGKRLAIQG